MKVVLQNSFTEDDGVIYKKWLLQIDELKKKHKEITDNITLYVKAFKVPDEIFGGETVELVSRFFQPMDEEATLADLKKPENYDCGSMRLVEGNSGKTLLWCKNVTTEEYQMVASYLQIMRKKVDEAREQFKREHPGLVGADLNFAIQMMDAAHPHFYLTNAGITNAS